MPDYGTPAYWDGFPRAQYILDAMKAAASQPSTIKQWYGYQNYMDPYLKDLDTHTTEITWGPSKKIKKLADPYNVLDFPMGLAHA